MNLLFIDTNIYLRFYESNQSDYKKLLKALVGLKENIFITEQISDEINRNKLAVFKQSIDNYKKQLTFSKVNLPEHLDNEDADQIKLWNENRKIIENNIKNSEKEFDEIVKSILVKITKSEDSISIGLNDLLSTKVLPDINTIAKARNRKELGNPPGKANDPLGDQISWEQLLLKCIEVNVLYIITNDFDYCTINGEECYLNAFLYNELFALNPTIKVKCFNNLANALRSFNTDIQEIENLPSSDELTLISKQESASSRTVFFGAGIEFEPDPPECCNICGMKNFSTVRLVDNFTGIQEIRFVCNACGGIYARHL